MEDWQEHLRGGVRRARPACDAASRDLAASGTYLSARERSRASPHCRGVEDCARLWDGVRVDGTGGAGTHLICSTGELPHFSGFHAPNLHRLPLLQTQLSDSQLRMYILRHAVQFWLSCQLWSPLVGASVHAAVWTSELLSLVIAGDAGSALTWVGRRTAFVESIAVWRLLDR